MRGSRNFIYSKIAEREDCPIKDEEIIRVIIEEYDKEFNRLIQYNESPVIFRKGLGSWYTKNGKLRNHIRYLIKSIRNARSLDLQEGSRIKLQEETMVKRLRVCLLQLNDIRKVFIARKNRWELKKLNNKGNNDQ